jgi:hypothetical protein
MESPFPVIDNGDPAPSELIDTLKCQCKAQGKMCSSEACGCHKEHISCTSYCYCSSKEGCLNPFTKTVESVATNTGGVDQEESEDMDQDDDIDCPDDVDYHENCHEDENKDESTESDFITDDEWD